MKLSKGHKLYTKDGRVCGNGTLDANAWCPDEKGAFNSIKMDDGSHMTLSKREGGGVISPDGQA